MTVSKMKICLLEILANSNLIQELSTISLKDNYGEGGGLHNGKISGPKLFAPPPPQDRVKLVMPPPPPPPFKRWNRSVPPHQYG